MTFFTKPHYLLTLSALLIAACANDPPADASASSETTESSSTTSTADTPTQGTVDANPDDYIPGQMNLEVVAHPGSEAEGNPGTKSMRMPCVSSPTHTGSLNNSYEIDGEPARDRATLGCRLITPDTWCVNAEITSDAGDVTSFDWSCQHIDAPVTFGENVATGIGALDIRVIQVILPPE